MAATSEIKYLEIQRAETLRDVSRALRFIIFFFHLFFCHWFWLWFRVQQKNIKNRVHQKSCFSDHNFIFTV